MTCRLPSPLLSCHSPLFPLTTRATYTHSAWLTLIQSKVVYCTFYLLTIQPGDSLLSLTFCIYFFCYPTCSRVCRSHARASLATSRRLQAQPWGPRPCREWPHLLWCPVARDSNTWRFGCVRDTRLQTGLRSTSSQSNTS